MKEYIDNAGFYVTDDAAVIEKLYPATEALAAIIDKFHSDVKNGKAGTADRLIKQIKKHPRSPQLKNLLTTYYQVVGQTEKAFTYNRKTTEAHPNYFFAKVNLVNEYNFKEEYDKVTGVLGENFDLKELYPERDTFYISEVMSMYKFAVIYHSHTQEFQKAFSFIKRMKEIDKNNSEIKVAEEILLKQILQNDLEEDDSYIDEIQQQEPTFKTEKPVFNHPEIEQLYQQGIGISWDVLDEILNLPRTTLMEDLVTVLDDGIDRFSFFEDQGWDEERHLFVFHAINLLTELNAVEELPAVLKSLKQREEYIEFFINDFFTAFIWISIFKLGQNQLNVLEEFMKMPNIYTFSKTEISKAVKEIVIHHPERRSEVIQWYASIFEFYKNAADTANVVDFDLVNLMVGDVIDFKGIELLPEITTLFELNYVSIGMCGDLDAVKQEIKSTQVDDHRMETSSMKEMYDNVLTTWTGNDDDDEENFSPCLPTGTASFFDSLPQESSSSVQKTVVSKQKIGRNDPCSCGSGKKYKKCCL